MTECEHDWFEMESDAVVTVEGLRQCRKCGGVSLFPGATDAVYEVKVTTTPMTATEVLAGQLALVGCNVRVAVDTAERVDHLAVTREIARGGCRLREPKNLKPHMSILAAAFLLASAPAFAEDATDRWNSEHSYTHYGDQQSAPQHWGDTPYSNMVAPAYRDQPTTDWNAMVPPAARVYGR